MNQPDPKARTSSGGAARRRAPIAVVVDGSAECHAAIAWSAREAAMHGTSIQLVHSRGSVRNRSGKAVFADARAALGSTPGIAGVEITEIATGGLLGSGFVPITARAHMLVIAAGSVQGQRTRLGAPYPALLAAKAKCPVVVIPRDMTDEGHVVVGVDGAGSSEDAIAVAFEEAAGRGVALKAVHTWNDFQLSTAIADDTDLPWDAVETGEKVVLSERLAGWRARFPDVPVIEIVTKDSPARQLAHQSRGAALLVIGSHGRGPISGLVFRSTSESLMYASRCPLVVVRKGLREER
ncbi:universal stress protein [Lolliginicoccus suaedae]|uniref:universal stress protein n=1 Tax=Lolliginicoccus suaedae TaxID=2605429 RepID=UPI0016594ADF|nr:universal stress protein [Lolliginicoccus suaedae]